MSRPNPGTGLGKYFAIFTLSGFSGLIYESIWTHYLKLFLGHAAYAQTLVLAIFMGGMAVGAWLCARVMPRWRNLLVGYAVVEAVVGVFALLFHATFVATVDVTLSTLLPTLGLGSAATIAKWSVGTLLILPQSILLGMTFPLMSGGLIRRVPDAMGRTIATLYFVNSLGGALGVLASGFWLIDRLGLPGTMMLAGGLNLVLALAVAVLSRAEPEHTPSHVAVGTETAAAADDGRMLPFLLGVAALTGTSSFFYEIGWIRMLALVLGSSTHAFELMLSAFILGLALGGLWIRRRIDRVPSPLPLLGRVQIAMGLGALATLPLHGLTFDWMDRVMDVAPRTDAGYAYLMLASHGIASLVMMPAAICAGMTLPLVMQALLRGGHGERSIGLAYAANTIGAIVGVFAAVHLVMPALGLKNVIVGGAAVDLALGVALLGVVGAQGRRLEFPAALGVSLLALALAHGAVAFDPNRLSSGVFRVNQSVAAAEAARMLFYADGKTATVAVLALPKGVVEIRTNGKADASIDMSGTGHQQRDEGTMVLTGALPLLLHPQARTAVNVGFGSGLTAHVLLSHTGLERVDTVEIEPRMVEGARAFLPHNRLAYEDPRSVITIEDAKSFFAGRRATYDIVVSEPSNPWVSGVASLFSREYYALVTRHLAPDGIFTQWLQLYEFDEPLLVSVLKALDATFADWAIYAVNRGDVLVVATNAARVPDPPASFPAEPALVAELERVGVAGPDDVALRRLGTKRSLAPLLALAPIPANSDYHPVLDQRANRARFLDRSATELVDLALEPLPHVELLEGRTRVEEATRASLELGVVHPAVFAGAFRDHVLDPASSDGRPGRVREAERLLARCRQPPRDDPVAALFDLGQKVVPYLHPAEDAALWRELADSACVGGLAEKQRDWLAVIQAVGRRDAGEMADAARRLLAAGGDRTPAERRYLCAVGMLGSIASGRPEQARALWEDAGEAAYRDEWPSLFIRLLAAHAGVTIAVDDGSDG